MSTTVKEGLLTFVLDESSGTAAVSRCTKERMPFDVVIPDEIVSNGKGYKVTGIDV